MAIVVLLLLFLLSCAPGKPLAGKAYDYPATDLVAHWSFDEASGTVASSSVGSSMGTLTDGSYDPNTNLPFFTFGKFGNAVQFDGKDDYVDPHFNTITNIPNTNTGFSWGGPYSIALWLKPTNFNKGWFMENGDWAVSSNSEGGFIFRVHDWRGYAFGSSSTPQLSLNNWNFFVLTYDPSNSGILQVFSNGLIAVSGLRSITTDGSLFIGRGDGNVDQSFEGLIDELAIYNKILTITEIQDLMCGDGTVQSFTGNIEQCDDGNTVDSDGCSSVCMGEDRDGDSRFTYGSPVEERDCDDRPAGEDGIAGTSDDGENIYPGNIDACGDGIDNDCDGVDLPCSACTTATAARDCDDGEICTRESCVSGRCEYSAASPAPLCRASIDAAGDPVRDPAEYCAGMSCPVDVACTGSELWDATSSTCVVCLADADCTSGYECISNACVLHVNSAPTADAGADQVVVDIDDDGEEYATITGVGADSDGTISTYAWNEGTVVLGNMATLSVSFLRGIHTLTFTATDNAGATASDEVVIDVREPVRCTVAATDCDDGLYCTVDACDTTANRCAYALRDVDDSDICTEDVCNEAVGGVSEGITHTLDCTPTMCSTDTRCALPAEACKNGVLEGSEQCEFTNGIATLTQSCSDISGFITGTLGCTAYCNYDTSFCIPACQSDTDCTAAGETCQNGLCVVLLLGDTFGDTLPPDSDGDGISDTTDTCPLDATNDASDSDGICDDVDNCVGIPNPLQEDEESDGSADGVGDACEDDDADGVLNALDYCSGTVAGEGVDSSGCPLPAALGEACLSDGGCLSSACSSLQGLCVLPRELLQEEMTPVLEEFEAGGLTPQQTVEKIVQIAQAFAEFLQRTD